MVTIVLCVLAVIICSLAAYVTYDRHQQRKKDDRAYAADKALFARIEQDVELVKANLEPKLQPGDTATISKSCGYTSAKFSKGDLICGVRLNISYTDKSTDKTDQIKEAAMSSGRFNGRDASGKLLNDSARNLTKSETYFYRSDNSHDFCVTVQKDYGLADYQFDCSYNAKEPIYTVIN